MPRPVSLVRRAAFVAVAVAAVAACGDDGRSAADERADQAHQVALDAGLDDDVADFLALAARGADATYTAVYPAPDPGTRLVVTSDPPQRRVDVVESGEVVESRFVDDGAGYTCRPTDAATDPTVTTVTAPESTAPTDPGWECDKTDALVEAPGVFTAEALDEATTALAARLAQFRFTIESRTVAEAEATCLVTTRKEGVTDPAAGEAGTFCVSSEGVLLLADQGGERLEAEIYGTDIPDGAFARPA